MARRSSPREPAPHYPTLAATSDDTDQVVEAGEKTSVSVLEAIPALYATEDTPEGEKVVHLHYFVGSCDWWVVELDSAERPQLAFGYACLGDPQMAEWGYIDLHELVEIWRPPSFGEPRPGGVTSITPALIVERELGWTPRPAGEVIPYLR